MGPAIRRWVTISHSEPMRPDVEADLINTFVVRARRERYISFLHTPRRRRDFLDTLYHFADFNPARVFPVKGRQDTAAAIIDELRRRGAGGECYVISVDADVDGTTGTLEDVIADVHTRREGTLVGCLPGRLGYYEGEMKRLILDANAAGRR
jgi:hypothetical protein